VVKEPNGVVLDAYRHAWRVRKRTGETSDEVLVAALRQHEAPARFSDPESPEYEVLVDFWRRGVSPRWLPVAGFAQAVRQSLAPWLEVFSDREESWAWMQLPAGKRSLSEESAAPIALRSLEFHRAADSEDTLSDCRDAPLDESGWHRAVVWLQMSSTEPVADVMVGQDRIGWTPIPADDWQSMQEAAQQCLYADGFLQVGRMHNGECSLGSLHCFFIA
jgi:hypothetical protein